MRHGPIAALVAATFASRRPHGVCRAWQIKSAAVLLILSATLLSSTQRSAAREFDQVIVFGDSNVDSGYYKLLNNPGGGTTYNSLWASAVAAGAGAPTTNPGPVNSQILAGFFGLSANPANTHGGTNYATSGAKNVSANNSQTGGFTAAIPTVMQIANYLTANNGKANPRALYFVHSGDNDVKYAAGETGKGPFPPNPDSYTTQAADELASAVQTLYKTGAQHIMVSGLEYDFPENDATLKALKLLYTHTLWNQLTSLGVPFIQADVNSVRVAIAANPSLYGFTTISDTGTGPSCTQPSGVTTAWALLCSSNTSAPSTWAAPAESTHLFADDQHLGTAGQRLMAEYLYRLVASLRADPTSGAAPLAVIFRATDLSPPLTYTINFGDGTAGALRLTSDNCFGRPPVDRRGYQRCSGFASHTYASNGSYTATLLNAANSTVGIAQITVRGGWELSRDSTHE
jgi:phospholipase/lecithinase/hemolysin